ncbi:hypothetical protein [Sphingobium sp.]|uniref:hypothetical protein n=1 Tax=Sphingobium sp. TaxID=1912891 RepID=UPI0028BD2422|nr:hypothetical protein [Sphingobium sp.]
MPQIDLTYMNSVRPIAPPSRPLPDFLKPPKGTARLAAQPLNGHDLGPQFPGNRRSRLRIAADGPYSVSFARAMPSTRDE